MQLPVDIACSASRCTLEADGIRLGLNYVNGFGADRLRQLEEARQAGPFTNLADLCHRTRLPRLLIERLIAAGALDGWGIARRQLLWGLGTLHYQTDELDLPIPHTDPQLPVQSRAEAFAGEIDTLGLSPSEHVMTFYRAWLDAAGMHNSATLESCDDGQRVRVAGLCVVHQAPPTAKGFHFLTLEDEWGMVNVIVSPGLVVRDGRHLHGGRVLLVEGVVQREAEVINIIKTNPFLDATNFSSCQATLRRLDKAFQAFFRRLKTGEVPGYPRFKGRNCFDTVVFPSYGDGCRFDGRCVYFQHIGRIKVKLHRPIEGQIKTISFHHSFRRRLKPPRKRSTTRCAWPRQCAGIAAALAARCHSIRCARSCALEELYDS